MNRRRIAQWIGIGFLLVAVGLGAFAYRQAHRYKHFAVHDPEMVYRSAWLEGDVFAELIETYQIRTIINLCDPGEMGQQRWLDERKAVRGAGAQLLEITMPRTVNANNAVVGKYVEVLRNPDSYPVLIHCQHGVKRTAEVLAIYDILFRGMTADQSLKRMPLFGRKDHDVSVKAFAASFEKLYELEAPEMARQLGVLREVTRK